MKIEAFAQELWHVDHYCCCYCVFEPVMQPNDIALANSRQCWKEFINKSDGCYLFTKSLVLKVCFVTVVFRFLITYCIFLN